MKIKHLGFTSFSLTTDSVTVVTDPNALEKVGMRFPKSVADVIISSNGETPDFGKLSIESEKRNEPFLISQPGEYEVMDVMIQRPVSSKYFILDYEYIRVVYLGLVGKDVNPDEYGDLGDVDVLFLPVGNGDMFPDYEKLEKIISKVEPKHLVPFGFQEEKMKGDSKTRLKTKEEFFKHFGYTNYRQEKTLKVENRPEKEEYVMEIVLIS